MSDDKLKLAGEKAAEAMEELWKLDVFDPPIGSSHARARFCLDVIEKIIGANGWSWALPYRGDGPPQWCGMTAGYAWAKAGLDTTWLSAYFASTVRLQCWATYQRWDRKSKDNPKSVDADRRRYVKIWNGVPDTIEPRPGDIVIVGDGNPTFGDHVTVNMGYDRGSGVFDTISGNGGGFGPRGESRQGISRRRYAIGQPGYRPMYLIRPAARDLL